MAYKDYGPNVSQTPQAVAPGGGSFTAEDHSFETVIYQSNNPIMDWEMNLLQEVRGSYGLRKFSQDMLPSCFLTGDFLEDPGGAGSYLPVTPDPGVGNNANRVDFRASNLIVNGWMVRLEYSDSGTVNMNRFVLPAPPAAGVRTDFVFLEVWRAALAPAPDTVNKSPTGQILRHGNAKAPDSSPNVNLADDILDTTMLVETQRRVQIQYRYRVFSGIDFSVYTDGFEDPTLFANTVPYHGGSGVDGNATTYNYAKHATDSGLWIAGENNATGVTNIGSVDGFIYAIPICVIYRRNSTAFNRTTNPNGGTLMAAGPPSDRPDGLYSDQITLEDIRDMRKSVAWDLHEVLTKATQQLFDNSLSVQHEVTALGTGGSSVFIVDELGVAGHAGDPDAVRANFSDRSVTESVVCEVSLVATDNFTLDLSSLPIAWVGAPVNVLSISSTACIKDVVHVNIEDAGDGRDAMTSTSTSPYLKSLSYATAVGPGIDQVSVTLSAPITATVYVELLVSYPTGLGLSRAPLLMSNVWTPPAASIGAWVDATTLTVTSDANRYSLDSTLWWGDSQHHELSMRLKSTPNVLILQSTATGTVWIPDTVTGTVTVDDGINPAYPSTNYAPYEGFTELTLTPNPGSAVAVSVTYEALRPAPPVTAPPGDSYQVFHYARAVQSLPTPAGPFTLGLIPRADFGRLHVIVSGSGSPDTGQPYAGAGEQLPVTTGYPEYRLDGPGAMQIDNFPTTSGYVMLSTIVPYSPNPSEVQLYLSGGDPTLDADGRHYWPRSHNPAGPDMYSPGAAGIPLTEKVRHKTALPVLVELKEDVTSIGRRGTLLLMVVTKWTEYDDSNVVSLSSSLGDSCAALYRVRGNMMNPRRSDV